MQRVVRFAKRLGVVVCLIFGAVAPAIAGCERYPTPDIAIYPPNPRSDQPVQVIISTMGTIYYSVDIVRSGDRIDVSIRDLWTPVPPAGQYPPACLPFCDPSSPSWPDYSTPPPLSCMGFGKTFAPLPPGTYHVYAGAASATFTVAAPPAVPLHPAALALLAIALAAAGVLLLRR